MKFRQDVESVEGLKGQFRSGLQALKAADRARLTVEKPANLAGSIDIDSAMKSCYPNDSRWDYAVGYKRNAKEVMLYWIEVHPASGGQAITEINRKFDWLARWVATTRLRRYPGKHHWIASGKSSFTALHPKIKALAQRGVLFSGAHLRIANED